MQRLLDRSVFFACAALATLTISACANGGNPSVPITSPSTAIPVAAVTPTPTPVSISTSAATATPASATATPASATATPVAPKTAAPTATPVVVATATPTIAPTATPVATAMPTPTPLPSPVVYYVADGASQAVNAYAVGANGNVAPVRSITGSNTGLGYSRRVALDLRGTLYVANAPPMPQMHSVTEYAVSSTGDVAPLRTIAGAATGLTGADGETIDAAGELYIGNCTACFQSSGSADSIFVFAAGANGDVAPIRAISGSNTMLFGTTNVSLDPSGQTLYATCSCGTAAAVYTFPATGTGNIAPSTILTGTNTTFGGEIECAVATSTTLYVCDTQNDAIVMFAIGASGNAAPIGSLAGSLTQLASPTEVKIDSAGNLYVANAGGPYITVYPAGASKNTPPSRIVMGSATGLQQPIGLQLSP